MKKLPLVVFLAFIFIIGILVYSSDTVSIRKFLGFESPQARNQAAQVQPKSPKKETAQADNSENNTGISGKLDFDEIRKIVSIIDENQKKVILSSDEAFRKFIQNEAANKSVLAAAHANKIDQDERNLFIAHRGEENILREIYLKKLIANKIPADFPTEKQLHAYYDKNKKKFVVQERVHVWQIFLPFSDPADTKEVELVKKKAETIITDINKNKIDFEAAARKYSEQLASKYRGGYMGMVKVDDLKPPIKDTLMSLAPGKISNPVKTEEGIHILKRGNTVPEQVLSFDEVKNQIKQLMENQLQSQLREAIYKQASKTYPVDVSDKTAEEWRLKLRTNITTPVSNKKATNNN